jgi:transcriptional regulator with XRE-family HTH domain
MPSSRQKLQMQRFSLRLQEALSRKGTTAPQLAGQLRVDPSTIHRWLKEGQIPQPRTVSAIADALSVSKAWLMSEEGALPPGRVKEIPQFDYQTEEGCRAAFDYILEAMPLPRLIDRLAQILNDASQSAEKRVSMAKAILPIIERRKTELEGRGPPPK